MPGSRLGMRAAPSNSWSMALKIDPLAAMALLSVRVETGQPSVARPSESMVSMRDRYNASDENRCRKRQGALAARDARAGTEEVARARGGVHDDFRPPDRS